MYFEVFRYKYRIESTKFSNSTRYDSYVNSCMRNLDTKEKDLDLAQLPSGTFTVPKSTGTPVVRYGRVYS